MEFKESFNKLGITKATKPVRRAAPKQKKPKYLATKPKQERPGSDYFFMVNLKAVEELAELKGNELKMFFLCAKLASFGGTEGIYNNVLLNNDVFKRSCRREGFNLSDASIDNIISHLCKKGILQRIMRGGYILNPKYVIKGRVQSISFS